MFGQKRLSREGGVEIVVKELCTRIVKLGNNVTCLNRSSHHVKENEFDGIELTHSNECGLFFNIA